MITTLVTRRMAALLQSSVQWVEWSSEVKVYYLASPEEVLDEGEGLDVVENFLIWEALLWAVVVWRCCVWPGSSLGFADVKV